MFRLHSILQKKENKSQTSLSGSFLLKPFSNLTLRPFCLFICLFLIGSCNEKTAFFDFSKQPVEIAQIEKGDLVRYSYAMQATLMRHPENLKALNITQAKLALSSPDLNRVDGKRQVWQYRSDACVLDIFWDAQGQVMNYEFRARQNMISGAAHASNVAEWQCLQGIIQDRRHAIEAGFSDTHAVLSLNAHKS